MTVYQPREDSHLMKKYLEKQDLENKKTLDIGTGSGIQAITMAKKNAEVTATDINPEALKKAEEKAQKQGLSIEFKESDLFQNINQKYDIITFNPPYLPGEKGIGDEEIWRGGETGLEITEKFLEQLKNHLNSGGYGLTIISSKTDWKKTRDKHGLEIIDSKKLWFETVYLAIKR